MMMKPLLITCLSVLASNETQRNVVQIDHIVLAVKELESGVRQFEEKTGVKPIYGGSHPDRDTHNALVSLEGGIYIEILAPKDDLVEVPEFFKGFDQLTPVGFAISVSDMVNLHERVKKLGFKTNGIEAGSRHTPEGKLLKWELLLLNDPNLFMNPFFISWSDDSSHPTKDQSVECTLKTLQFTTPNKKDVKKIFKTLETEVWGLSIELGSTSLSVSINTPKGEATFK